MPLAKTNDGVELYYEETGSGVPIVFVHEFAGDMRSWEHQIRHFGNRYRCLAFNARGYPPSGVPESHEAYSQLRAVDDILAVMDEAGIDRAHIVGLSMGGFAALHLGLRAPQRALSLCVAGVGYGAEPDRQAKFRQEAEAWAAFLLGQGIDMFAEHYSLGPTRLSFRDSDPRGFDEFRRQLATHSALGSANTQFGVQRNRPSLYDLAEELGQLTVPTLILNGDEDFPCLAPGLMLKAVIPAAALCVIPNCGHTMNLEAVDEFNRLVGSFLVHAQSGRWPVRDVPRQTDSATGMSSGAETAPR